ncbi:hypothetical protein GWI33_022567 [Rhynchophorus ferrugineus]|uniref:C-type lectin domain-containing protein n=1 Tax=Rhynchophorus ferrugineus TaxID=354439 RepID=A0A834IUG3_RHYFE|nr:hypothetical protein GWI33_022567 [Rhynchophorus ferrugineus]
MIYPLLIFIIVTILAINLYYFEFVRGSDKTYFVSDEAANWTDAKQACREAGMELASVLNEKERVSLEKFIERYKLTPSDKWTGYWLSGIRYPNGTFIWDTTGTQVGEETSTWVGMITSAMKIADIYVNIFKKKGDMDKTWMIIAF